MTRDRGDSALGWSDTNEPTSVSQPGLTKIHFQSIVVYSHLHVTSIKVFERMYIQGRIQDFFWRGPNFSP